MKTLFDKVWDSHIVAQEEDETLLYVDRCLIHEGSRHTFDALHERGLSVAHPDKVFAFSDHYIPTDPQARSRGVASIPDAEIRNMVELLIRNTDEYKISRFGWGDARQGILHVAGPELGLSQPGIVLVGADSHTSTHGAFGNLSFGIGASETTHVVATQTIWQRRPNTLHIRIDGSLGFGVTAKDIILAVIAKIGIGGAIGYAIEYAGSAIAAMSMNERMTICNMSIEAGGRAGMIAPDDTTYQFLAGRPFSPKGQAWDDALKFWRTLPSDAGAKFGKEVDLDAARVVPMVTWGTNPEQSLPITERVPDPDKETDAETRIEYGKALSYMGLKPGMPLTEIAVDRVFIGSCTNSRIDDIRAAAAVAKLGRAVVPAWVVPGSESIKRQAEAEGLDRIFTDAGFEWRNAGCSLCTALNGDQLKPGERCGSTSNRNFQGRQGPGGRTHLMSPAMAAAAALRGHLVDVRELGGELGVMEAFTTWSGIAVPFDETNLDTNQLCPTRFNKVPWGPRFAQILLHDRRFNADGSEKPDYILNQEPYRRAVIAVAGRNFGVGSSRETAVLGLMGFGIRSVIAPNFGDIFYNNSLKNGVLPVRLPPASVDLLLRQLLAQRGAQMTVDLRSQTVTGPDGATHPFDIAPLSKKRLLRGLDEIAHTQEYGADIKRFEDRHAKDYPWLEVSPA